MQFQVTPVSTWNSCNIFINGHISKLTEYQHLCSKHDCVMEELKPQYALHNKKLMHRICTSVVGSSFNTSTKYCDYITKFRPYVLDVEPAAKYWCNTVCIMLRYINTIHSSSTKIRETTRHSSKTHTYAYCCFCQNWHAYSEGGLAYKQWRKGTRGGREVQKTRIWWKRGEGGTENDETGRVMETVIDSVPINGRIQPTFPLTLSFYPWVSYLRPCYCNSIMSVHQLTRKMHAHIVPHMQTHPKDSYTA